MNKVCILGSINMDLVAEVVHMPKVGETIHANNFSNFPGGKGLNQAIAASRLRGQVSFVGKVGEDVYGTELVNVLKEEDIDIKNIVFDKTHSTGQAFIMIDKNANNSIIVVGGANMNMGKEDILLAKEKIVEADVLVSQFEVPMEAILESFKIAKDNDVITILNPAPAKKILDEIYGVTDIIIPNETELALLTGRSIESLDDVSSAAREVIKRGVKYVIATLGEKGAMLVSEERSLVVPAEKTKAVDTTAAGDSFIGALSLQLSNMENIEEQNLQEIIRFCNKVASITIQRKGAQPSLPYFNEIK